MLACTGCSLLHHHSAPPQQQFLTALKRGDSMQANLIWLNMNAEDRANLSHSIGITPQASPAEIKAQLARHAREKAEEDGEGGGEMVNHAQFETGDINSQIIDMPGLDADPAGGLQNLPNLPGGVGSSPSGAPVIENHQ